MRAVIKRTNNNGNSEAWYKRNEGIFWLRPDRHTLKSFDLLVHSLSALMQADVTSAKLPAADAVAGYLITRS